MVDLDTATEQAAPNGWKTFDDDQAFLKHIFSKKPAEELVEIPEWEVKVLCRALSAETRIDIQVNAYDEKTKKTDYRRVFHLIVIGGCYNPTTGHKIFTESHKNALMREQNGAVIERLALIILRLSAMLGGDAEKVRKN